MDPIGALDPITGLLPDSLKPLGAIWFLWVLFVFWTLMHPGAGRNRWLAYINGGLANQYRRRLRRFLGITAKCWFKDYPLIYQARRHRPPVSHFGIKTLSEPSFDFSLRLALLYPVLAFVLFWAISAQDGRIGAWQVLPNFASVWWRGLTLGWLLSLLWLFYQAFKKRHWVYLAVVFAFSVVSAGAFAGAGAGAGAGVVAVAVAVAVAFAGGGGVVVAAVVVVAFAGAGVVAGAVAFAGAVAVAVAKLYFRLRHTRYIGLFWLSYLSSVLLVGLGVIYWLSQSPYQENSLILLLFYQDSRNTPCFSYGDISVLAFSFW